MYNAKSSDGQCEKRLSSAAREVDQNLEGPKLPQAV